MSQPTVSFSNAIPVSGPVLIYPVSPGDVLTGQFSVPVRFGSDVGLLRAELFIEDAGEWKSLALPVALSGLEDAADVIVDTTVAANGPTRILAQVFDTSGANNYALLEVVIANAVPPNLDPGVSQWLKEIARPTTTGEAVGNAVAAAGHGTSIVVGDFKGEVRFGPGVTKTAIGGSDIFIAKVGAHGNILWVKTFGGSSNDSAASAAVDVDASGNIYVTGYFFGTADFGGGPLIGVAGVFGSDIFVAKYSPNGTHIWSKHFGSTLGNNSGEGIAVDPAGDVFVAGKIYGDVVLGGGIISTHAGSADGFVLKMAGVNGDYMWAKDFGGIDSDNVKGLAVDQAGDAVVVGLFYGANIDFGDGPQPNQGSADLFMAKYRGTDGHLLWTRVMGGPGPDAAEGVAVDTERNIFLVGSYYGSIDLGSGYVLTAPIESGSYLAKYDPDGNLQWARSIAAETAGGATIARGVAVDSVGNVVVIGNASGGVSFGSGPTSYGDANIYLAKYGLAGEILWVKRSANIGRCSGLAIAIDSYRDILGTGSIQDVVNIDGLLIASPGAQIKSTFLYKVKESADTPVGAEIVPLTYTEGAGGSWYSPAAAAADPVNHNGWVNDRTADATRYRETFPAFEPDGDYFMRILIPLIDPMEPFDVPVKGRQLADPGQQLQTIVGIDQISLLPTFYKAPIAD